MKIKKRKEKLAWRIWGIALWVILFIAVVNLVLITGYAVTTYIMDRAPQENERRVHNVVKEVCGFAYDSNNDALNVACAKATSAANVKYVCEPKQVSHAGCYIEEEAK